MTQSMSRKRNGLDNAVIENGFAMLQSKGLILKGLNTSGSSKKRLKNLSVMTITIKSG